MAAQATATAGPFEATPLGWNIEMSRSPKHIALLAIWAAATAAWSQPISRSAAADSALAQIFGDYRDELLVFDEVASDSVLAVYRFRGPRPRSLSHIVIVAGNGVVIPYYCYDCLDYIRDNIPTVSALQAVEIAERNGLTRGLRPWRISHHWYAGDVQRFVWTVKNTESVGGVSRSGPAWGQIVVIDASAGVVLMTLQWVAEE